MASFEITACTNSGILLNAKEWGDVMTIRKTIADLRAMYARRGVSAALFELGLSASEPVWFYDTTTTTTTQEGGQ